MQNPIKFTNLRLPFIYFQEQYLCILLCQKQKEKAVRKSEVCLQPQMKHPVGQKSCLIPITIRMPIAKKNKRQTSGLLLINNYILITSHV